MSRPSSNCIPSSSTRLLVRVYSLLLDLLNASVSLCCKSFKLPYHLLKVGLSIRPEACDLLYVCRRHVIDLLPLLPQSRNGFSGQRKSHVLWSIHKLEDRRGCLIFFDRLYPQYARISTRSVHVSFSKWATQLRPHLLWSL
jgi:hypothetical protein